MNVLGVEPDSRGKNPETTVVTIDEVETGNWGIAGETVSARRVGVAAARKQE